MNKVKILGNRVLLKKIVESEMKGKLIITPEDKEQMRFVVIGVGEGKKLASGETLPIPLKVGDVIYANEFQGQRIKIDDEEHLSMPYEHVLAVEER